MGPDFLDSLSCVCFVSIYLSSVFNSKQFFWPDIRLDIGLSGQPDIRQTKPDIRPDTKKGRISGATLLICNYLSLHSPPSPSSKPRV